MLDQRIKKFQVSASFPSFLFHFRCSKIFHDLFSKNFIHIFTFPLFFYRDYFALNVYVALCYYKLDYYDVAQEVLQVYLQKYPDSAIAINLKACNHFRLYNGNAAQSEMKQLIEKMSNSFSFSHDLIRHNAVVRNTFTNFFSLTSSTNPIFPFFFFLGFQRWRRCIANFAQFGGCYTRSQTEFSNLLFKTRRRAGSIRIN